jgi:hypothetical protein
MTTTHDLDTSVQLLLVYTVSQMVIPDGMGMSCAQYRKNTNQSTVIVMLSTRTDPTPCINLYITYEQIAKF